MSRRKGRPLVDEPRPIADTPAPPPSAPTPTTPTEIETPIEAPMPITTVVDEERLTLTCLSAFFMTGAHDPREVPATVEVSNLDDHKTTELARYADDVIELTSHLGTLTLSKRTFDAPAGFIARTTMAAPIFALVDEASQVPVTTVCETMKPLPDANEARFRCESEITAKTAPEAITSIRETILAVTGDERRIPLAELADYRLLAYVSQGEVTLVTENLAGDWIGAAVGSVGDTVITAEIERDDVSLKSSCRRLP